MATVINKALFRIVGATTSPSSDRGYNAVALETLTLSLEDSTGVLSVAWQLYDPAVADSPLRPDPDRSSVGRRDLHPRVNPVVADVRPVRAAARSLTR